MRHLYNIFPFNRAWKYSTPARADVGIGPYKGNELHSIYPAGSPPTSIRKDTVMVSLQALYDQAEQQNIPVLRGRMPACGSMSVQLPDGRCVIGLDSRPFTQPGERVHLGHELGHCLTGSFYNIPSPADLRGRHENRADKWAIRRLIPVDQLDDAIAAGHTELWDLADYFGVTEPFLKKALCLYIHGNLAAELYF